MVNETESLGGLALGGLSSKQKADLSGQACRNCGEIVEGRYCHACGQLAASFHRPIWSIIAETLGDTLALDGRLSRTIPMILFRPGRLTKRYTSGKRARYVPPFRLFLLASLLFFFTVFAFVGNARWFQELNLSSGNQGTSERVEGQTDSSLFDEDGRIDRDLAKEAIGDGEPLPEDAEAFSDQAFDIIDDPRLLLAGLEKWAPRFSLLLVPSTIFSLALLHFWRRRIYIYDHAIHALHLHSWFYLTGTVVLLITPLLGYSYLYLYGVLVTMYVCRSLMVVGDTGVFMAGMRTFALLIGWIVLVAIAAVFATVLSAVEL